MRTSDRNGTDSTGLGASFCVLGHKLKISWVLWPGMSEGSFGVLAEHTPPWKAEFEDETEISLLTLTLQVNTRSLDFHGRNGLCLLQFYPISSMILRFPPQSTECYSKQWNLALDMQLSPVEPSVTWLRDHSSKAGGQRTGFTEPSASVVRALASAGLPV